MTKKGAIVANQENCICEEEFSVVSLGFSVHVVAVVVVEVVVDVVAVVVVEVVVKISERRICCF